MKIFLKIIAAILIITLAAEFMLNRASSTALTISFAAVCIACIYFLIYKPLKTLL